MAISWGACDKNHRNVAKHFVDLSNGLRPDALSQLYI